MSLLSASKTTSCSRNTWFRRSESPAYRDQVSTAIRGMVQGKCDSPSVRNQRRWTRPHADWRSCERNETAEDGEDTENLKVSHLETARRFTNTTETPLSLCVPSVLCRSGFLVSGFTS